MEGVRMSEDVRLSTCCQKPIYVAGGGRGGASQWYACSGCQKPIPDDSIRRSGADLLTPLTPDGRPLRHGMCTCASHCANSSYHENVCCDGECRNQMEK